MPTTVHAVKGVGAKADLNTQDAFNPRLFHRGMADLQEYILDLNKSAEHSRRIENVDDQTFYTEFDDEEKTITLNDDSPISTVVNNIPKGWEKSVVIDANDSFNGFAAVVSHLSCGGGVHIWTKTIIRCGCIEEITIEFTDLAERQTDKETDSEQSAENVIVRMEKVNLPLSTPDLAEILRSLSNAITIGYTHTLSTATRALDFTVCEPTPKNSLTRQADNFYPIPRSYWSKVRDTSRQSIFNNISKAGNELSEKGINLHEDPIATQPNRMKGCLTELSPDADDEGYVRLL